MLTKACMQEPLDEKVLACKRLLFKLAVKHGVSPRLISERLLSRDDKNDMLEGLVDFESLDFHVKLWKEQGMCNYANGTMTPYEHFKAYVAKGVQRDG